MWNYHFGFPKQTKSWIEWALGEDINVIYTCNWWLPLPLDLTESPLVLEENETMS